MMMKAEWCSYKPRNRKDCQQPPNARKRWEKILDWSLLRKYGSNDMVPSDFWSLGLWKNKLLLFSAAQLVTICYGSCRRLIHCHYGDWVISLASSRAECFSLTLTVAMWLTLTNNIGEEVNSVPVLSQAIKVLHASFWPLVPLPLLGEWLPAGNCCLFGLRQSYLKPTHKSAGRSKASPACST